MKPNPQPTIKSRLGCCCFAPGPVAGITAGSDLVLALVDSVAGLNSSEHAQWYTTGINFYWCYSIEAAVRSCSAKPATVLNLILELRLYTRWIQLRPGMFKCVQNLQHADLLQTLKSVGPPKSYIFACWVIDFKTKVLDTGFYEAGKHKLIWELTPSW